MTERNGVIAGFNSFATGVISEARNQAGICREISIVAPGTLDVTPPFIVVGNRMTAQEVASEIRRGATKVVKGHVEPAILAYRFKDKVGEEVEVTGSSGTVYLEYN
jgi:hypothetical protein